MSKPISLRVDPDDLSRWKKWAKERGWTLSELIRSALHLAEDVYDEDAWEENKVRVVVGKGPTYPQVNTQTTDNFNVRWYVSP